MISRIFKVSHNFAFLSWGFIINTGWLDICKISRIISRSIFIFIVSLISILGVSCLVFSKLSNPLIVDVVSSLLILHYMNEVIAIQGSTPSSFLPNWLSSRGLIVINDWVYLWGSTVMVWFLLVVIEVPRADWLEQLARDWHVFSYQVWIGPIIKQKRRLYIVLLLWSYIPLPCT